jgi:hypothetical protein
LIGGGRSRRIAWGCLAREGARVPEVVGVNNYQFFFKFLICE